MHHSALVAALAIGAPVFAAPAANPDFISDAEGALEGLIDGFFTVAQEASKTYFKSGAIAYQKSYQKYNAQVPSNVAAAAAAAQSGSVTASPQQFDEAYLCPVKIGSNGQTVNLDFDTGSADLWVFTSELAASSRKGHDLYNPSTSTSSAKLSGYTWKISYGDGSGAKGDVYTDKVVVGPVTATKQAVEAASSVSAQFVQDVDNDGLLGLAFSSINTVSPKSQTTFFDTVKSSLAKPVFASYLRAGKAGSYDFGYIDTNKYTGSLAYAPIDSSQGFWSFNAGTAYAGSTSLGSLGASIADTGTTLILVEDAVVDAYYEQVSSASYDDQQGGYTFSCSETLPSFSITVNGSKRTTPGSYVNYAPIDSSGSTCFGGIQSSSGIGFNILGDVFLKSQYVVFDSQGPRIGFAPQK